MKTTIHFDRRSAVRVRLMADGSFLFHTMLAETARLWLAEPLSKCVTLWLGLALWELSHGSGMWASSPNGPASRNLMAWWLGSKNKSPRRECRNWQCLKVWAQKLARCCFLCILLVKWSQNPDSRAEDIDLTSQSGNFGGYVLKLPQKKCEKKQSKFYSWKCLTDKVNW